MKVDPSLLHRLFYPQVPAVLSAQYGGRISAMPVVSYASVSADPPLVAVACYPGGFTVKLASRARAFSLCLLGRSHLKAIERLASTSGKEVEDKLLDSGLAHRRAGSVDAPVIEGAEATLECGLDMKKRVGDHVLLIGLVRACYASENFSDFWDFRHYRPILYTGWKDGMSTLDAD